MANVYREKVCPTCDTVHRKRGEYCSKTCSGTGRPVSDNTRKKLRKKQVEHSQTPEAIANAKMFGERRMMPAEEFAVGVPDVRDIRDYDFLDNYPTDF
jgi:hypothetical protein